MNYNKLCISIIIISSIIVIPAYAIDLNSSGISHPQGITSSGLGTTVTSDGSTFNITGGTQQGGNLFHSFGKFNLHTGESAVFNDSGITNTISRITGGEYSWINGKIVSGAENLYLLNPAGILFGPNASLDLAGSFHVSTADYLRMGENEKFFVQPLENEILSVAAPAAFGFLDKNIKTSKVSGLISIEGKGEITEQEWDENSHTGLHVKEGNTVSIIGGDIEIKRGTYYNTGEEGEVAKLKEHPGSVNAPEGYINLVSVVSGGEVAITESVPDVSGFEKFGNISISDEAWINANGTGGGAVYIRAGEFVMNNSRINAITYGSDNGKGIDIQADNLNLTDGAWINAKTEGSGDSGNIIIKVSDSVTLSGENEQPDICKIVSNTQDKTDSAGDGGRIEITAKDVNIRDGAEIGTTSFGPGNAGHITVHTDNSITLSGENSNGKASKIVSNAQGKTESAGDGGSIEFTAKESYLRDGAEIGTTSFGTGNGGNIKIQSDLISLSGESSSGYLTKISSNAQGETEAAGNGGTIEINSGDLQITDGAQISAATIGAGNGGNINIQAGGTIRISGENISGDWQSGIYAGTESESDQAGDGGMIQVTAEKLYLGDGSQINAISYGTGKCGDIKIHIYDSLFISGKNSTDEYPAGIFASSYGEMEQAGDGGKIQITAKEVSLNKSGEISTSTDGGGQAGEIDLNISRLQLENNAAISSKSNAEENGGNAGTINVSASDSVKISGNSTITTEANGAGGGKISVKAGNEIYLYNGDITGTVLIGAGDGGDVKADSKFVILNHGNITANAEDGDGGAIFILTDNYIKSADSRITATSKRGNDGTVKIEAPDLDITSGMTLLPADTVDAAKWMKLPCSARSGEDISRFLISGHDSAANSLNDWLPGPLFRFDNDKKDEKRKD